MVGTVGRTISPQCQLKKFGKGPALMCKGRPFALMCKVLFIFMHGRSDLLVVVAVVVVLVIVVIIMRDRCT